MPERAMDKIPAEKKVIIITDREGREERIKEIILKRKIYAVVLRSVNDVQSASKKLKMFCEKHNVLLLAHSSYQDINYCDGVHLNFSFISKVKSISEVRKEYGSEIVIGYSSHSLGEAKKALSDGADYVFLSPVFKSKYEGVEAMGVNAFNNAVVEIGEGVFALGGVNEDNFDLLSNRVEGYAGVGEFFTESKL